MILFPTLGSFMGFMVISVALLVLVWVFDGPIRDFEDNLIEKIRKIFKRKPDASEEQ